MKFYIENKWKTVNLRNRKIKQMRVAIVDFGVNERQRRFKVDGGPGPKCVMGPLQRRNFGFKSGGTILSFPPPFTPFLLPPQKARGTSKLRL